VTSNRSIFGRQISAAPKTRSRSRAYALALIAARGEVRSDRTFTRMERGRTTRG